MQQRIFNELPIAQFFSQIAQQDKYDTLKELILLGINAINLKTNQNIFSYENLSKNQLIHELQSLRKKIDGLAAAINYQTIQNNQLKNSNKLTQQVTFKPITIKDQNGWDMQKNIKIKQVQNNIHNLKQNITPKVTEVVPQNANQKDHKSQIQNHNRVKKCRYRHHLDDSQVRQALINPFAKQTPHKHSKKDKKFLYQEELDKQELKMIHSAQNNEREQFLGRSKRSRTSHLAGNTLKAESKIKSLVAKDKIKYRQAHNEMDLYKYQYSSEEDQNIQQIQEVSKIYEAQKEDSSNGQSFYQKNTLPQFEKQPSFNPQDKKTLNYSKNISNEASQAASLRSKRASKPITNRKNDQSKEQSSDYSDFRYEKDKKDSKSKKIMYNNQYSSDDDTISQSSSFSKFSLGSQREVGKIGIRK